MRFQATIQQAGKTATGIHIPPEVVEGLAAGKKPPVRVTINGYTYRSSIATVDGRSMVGVSADVRAAASVAGGDEVAVDIELDNEPREVTVPADFAAALVGDPAARRTIDGRADINPRRHVLAIDGAKTPESRQRRIAKSVSTLHEGRS
jgi:hypothetical protein